MDLNLKGKKALVTGASYGLGYACARMLAAEGVDAILSSRNLENVTKASQEIKNEFGVQTLPFAADLSKKEESERLIQDVKNSWGTPDILVLSTGHPPTYPFSEATDEQWEKGYDLLIRPAIDLARAFLPQMENNGYGRLIFIGSIFGLEAESSSVIQSTLRAGLNGFSKCIATKYAAKGITSNVICPGYYDTPLVRDLAKQYAKQDGMTGDQVLEDWKTFAPVQKFGKPDDLGAFVAFMASPRAEFITGRSFALDGGALKSY